MVCPIFIVVSLSPSVSDQPCRHFVRSMVKPLGPVTFLPSADLPQLLSLMRLTMASRSLAHSASHSSIVVCSGGAPVVLVPAVVAVVLAPPVVVVVVPVACFPPPLLPQAAPRALN